MAYNPTQLQLTHVLQQLFRRLGGKVTLATSGSTTTLVDTKLADELADGNEDDIYNGGTVIVITDAGGANAAPEGEFSRVTDYVASSTTLTFSPAMTVAPAAGDTVMIVPPDFPLYDMIESVNDALKYLSTVPRFDTSITTAANQTEYTLPLALKGRQILNVEIQGITSDANDNRWQMVPNWRAGFAAAGSTGTFIIPQFATGYTVRITYLAEHARVAAYADFIDEHLDRNLVHSAVFAHALQWKNDRDALSGGADNATLGLEQKAWSQLDREMVRNRVSIPPRRVQGFPHWPGSNVARDEFPPVPTA
jgi:hypothetical protein